MATVEGNTLTIKATGETVITASQDGNEEFTPAPRVTQTLIVRTITAIEPTVNDMLVVYPNPTKDYLRIQSAKKKILHLALHDIWAKNCMFPYEEIFLIINLSWI